MCKMYIFGNSYSVLIQWAEKSMYGKKKKKKKDLSY